MIDRELADSLRLFAPELWIIAFTTLAMLLDLVIPRERRHLVGYVMILGLLTAATASAVQDPALSRSFFSGMVAADGFGRFLKILLALITATAALTALASDEVPDEVQGEFHTMLGAICLGMFVMVSATDLLMVYVGIEMVSITRAGPWV